MKPKYEKLTPEFLVYLKREKKLAPKSTALYKRYLEKFFEWQQNKTPKKQLSIQTINAYQDWLSNLRDVHTTPLHPRTINYHLIALRSFLSFLKKEKIRAPDPKEITLIKEKKQPKLYLAPHDRERLLAAPLDFGTTTDRLIAYRDRALLELMSSTSLPLTTLASRPRDAVDSLERGHKASAQARFWLSEYLKRRTDHSPFLFVAHDHGYNKRKELPLSPRTIQRIVREHARTAGLKGRVTSHLVRNTVSIS